MINLTYKIFCSFYSHIIGKFEKIFYKNKNFENRITPLNKDGFQKLKIKNEFDLNNKLFDEICVSNYFKRLIINKDDIILIIKKLFVENELANKITELTGYKYNIGFILCYKTLHVAKTDQDKSIYANHWHQDKPYSSNTLKIILPVLKISEKDGPMEILPKGIKFKDVKKNDLMSKIYKAKMDLDEILIFNPNKCLHRAGIPKEGSERIQIMLQLNVSRKWTFNSDIANRQNFREPKFPLFSYFGVKRDSIENF